MKKEENKEIVKPIEKSNNIEKIISMDVDNKENINNKGKVVDSKEKVNNIKKEEDNVEIKQSIVERKECLDKNINNKKDNSVLNNKRNREEEQNKKSEKNLLLKPKKKYNKKSKEEKAKAKHVFYIQESLQKGKRIFGCTLCKMYFKTKKQFKNKKSIKQNPMLFHSIKDLKFHFNNFHLEQFPEKDSEYSKKQLLFRNGLNQEISLLKKDYSEKSKENVNYTRKYSEMIRCKKCGFRDTHDKIREHKYLICNRLPRRFKDIKQKCMKYYLKDVYTTIDRFELTEISEIKITL